MTDEQIEPLDWPTAQPPGLADLPAPDGAVAETDPSPVRLTRTDPACNMHRFYGLELATSLFGE